MKDLDKKLQTKAAKFKKLKEQYPEKDEEDDNNESHGKALADRDLKRNLGCG